jgi:hypothetical protein
VGGRGRTVGEQAAKSQIGSSIEIMNTPCHVEEQQLDALSCEQGKASTVRPGTAREDPSVQEVLKSRGGGGGWHVCEMAQAQNNSLAGGTTLTRLITVLCGICIFLSSWRPISNAPQNNPAVLLLLLLLLGGGVSPGRPSWW